MRNKMPKIQIPKGYIFSTSEASIKKEGRKDIALIYSEVEANIAGTFTTNRVKAAPVKLNIKNIRSGRGQAIIINSGNANACTGEKGLKDAIQTAAITAKCLKINPSLVYVCSTGVIGTPMPMDRIIPKIYELADTLGKSDLHDVASAIMTTDTFPKIVSKKVKINLKTGVITGVCKGAGMIAPNMATMLCFIMTDIAVNQKALNKAIKDSVKKSFNRITIDGDMSTNDTALILSNGMLGNVEITENTPSYKKFKSALDNVTYALSRMIVMDGEGATKLIDIDVKGAAKQSEAEKVAFSIANSNLVKTAIYGNDSNWGRIMAAIGYSGVKFKEEQVDISLGKIKVVRKGVGTGKDKVANHYLKNNREIRISVNLNKGSSSARVLTCDLTEKYVRVNAEYRT